MRVTFSAMARWVSCSVILVVIQGSVAHVTSPVSIPPLRVPGILQNRSVALSAFSTPSLTHADGRPTIPALHCLAHEFHCAPEEEDSVQCIDQVKVCDTTPDCADGQDEEADMCRTHACLASHYKCHDGYCVPIGKICDYVQDCPDASDELHCNYRRCWHGEWQCKNRQCINQVFLCDGQQDCKDGSDESDCGPQAFLTCDGGKRVHTSFQCDGTPDCLDQSDEVRCGPCRDNHFRCTNGRCIPSSHVCDAECDCDGECEDEGHQCHAFYDGLPGLAFCKKHVTIHCNKTSRCIHSEFICDGVDDCMDGGTDEFQCATQSPGAADAFACAGADGRSLPGSVKCDYQRHCLGGEDERATVCRRPLCASDQFRCRSGQCIPAASVCNTRSDCLDGSDELSCLQYACPNGTFKCHKTGHCIPMTKVCDHHSDCPLDTSDEPATCPYRHRKCQPNEFRCDNGQCIPSKYVCQIGYQSALHGCLDGSHLTHCRDATCDGLTWLKCRNGPCYHSSLQCNGLPDCYKGSRTWTDEEGCPFQCSTAKECICVDVTIDCSNARLHRLPQAVESTITKFILPGNYFNDTRLNKQMFDKLHQMTVLDLSYNGIQTIPGNGVFEHLWQLRVLKLGGNLIKRLRKDTFSGLGNVRVLDLSGNRIQSLESYSFNGLSSLPQLDLSQQRLTHIPSHAFVGLRSLLTLNLSSNPLRSLHPDAFTGIDSLLTTLDILHTRLPWAPGPAASRHPVTVLRSLVNLYTGDARFCCSIGSHVSNCQPKVDFFSSCSDLMSNTVLRSVLWLMGLVALLANSLVIYWRCPDLARNRIHAFLIINLAIGDLFMGVYLLVIAGADSYYRGSYVYHLHEWKTSPACNAAGFLSTVSSELSLFTLLVLTVDRLLTILLPFHLKVRLTFSSARVSMLAIWLMVLVLALVPFIPVPYFDSFYARSGVCLALHITPQRFPGWEYSLFIFLALNMLACVLIIVAYGFMYAVTLRTRRAVDQNVGGMQRAGEARIARRMVLIILTNVACCLPISILSLLALAEVTVPDEMYSWVAVFLLPINAALNPILYTISTRPFRRTFGARVAYRTRHLRESLVASFSSSARRRASTTTIRSSTTLHRPSLPVTSPAGMQGTVNAGGEHEDTAGMRLNGPVKLLRPRRRSVQRGHALPGETYQRFQQRNHSC